MADAAAPAFSIGKQSRSKSLKLIIISTGVTDP